MDADKGTSARDTVSSPDSVFDPEFDSSVITRFLFLETGSMPGKKTFFLSIKGIPSEGHGPRVTPWARLGAPDAFKAAGIGV